MTIHPESARRAATAWSTTMVNVICAVVRRRAAAVQRCQDRATYYCISSSKATDAATSRSRWITTFVAASSLEETRFLDYESATTPAIGVVGAGIAIAAGSMKDLLRQRFSCPWEVSYIRPTQVPRLPLDLSTKQSHQIRYSKVHIISVAMYV